MTMISGLNPIYVDFSIGEQDYMRSAREKLGEMQRSSIDFRGRHILRMARHFLQNREADARRPNDPEGQNFRIRKQRAETGAHALASVPLRRSAKDALSWSPAWLFCCRNLPSWSSREVDNNVNDR